jgi:hypothetical protein
VKSDDRDALRKSYLEAFRKAHNTNNLPYLRYENGWWITRSMGMGGWTIRYRTKELVAMRDNLERTAAANRSKPNPAA